MPARCVKPFWECFQDNLNEFLRTTNYVHRVFNALSLDDSKKHASTSDRNYDKSLEGLNALTHPNKRKVIAGHAASSPFAHLTHAMMWEKNGET